MISAPRHVVCLLSVMVAWGSPRSRATDFDAARLERIPARMLKFVDEHQLVGAVTAIGTRDRLIRVDAVGRLNQAAERPLPKDAVFRIASMTKPVTAMAIMILADRGKLTVSDLVEQHLPEFRGQLLVTSRADGVTTLKNSPRPITVRDLLTHTSGLPGDFPPGLANLYATRHLSLAEAVLVSSQRPLNFEPGSKWAYCNAGIDTLGRIVEVVSGQSFEQFVSENLLAPLGMNDTSFFPSAPLLARVPPVYDVKDGKLMEATNILIGPPQHARHPIPAGGLYSTAADLARLYQMTLNAGRAGDRQILSATSLAEMTKLQTGPLPCGFVPGMGFGFGFAVVREPQGVTGMLSAGTFGHGGAFGTQGWIDPHRGLYVILLIQRIGLANGDASEMRHELQRLTYEAIRE